jgi:glutamyl-tRNA synthetase
VALRIEDLDASRVRPEARQGAVDDLAWLGLDWDEGPYVQSENLAGYTESLERLIAADVVYPCTCSRADIARAAAAPHAEEEGPGYPGTCAGRSPADAPALLRAGRSFAWRFRAPEGLVAWDDLVLGRVSTEPARTGGDFIVAREGVGPAYQLAVVRDDATQKVTQVIRGDDLVPSTPRQVLLYRALGWPVPAFGHVPLAVGDDRRRLAKRDGSIKLATLRAAGVDPRWLVGWLARSCGWTDSVAPTSPADWVGRSSLEAIPRQPWVVNAEAVAALMPGA